MASDVEDDLEDALMDDAPLIEPEQESLKETTTTGDEIAAPKENEEKEVASSSSVVPRRRRQKKVLKKITKVDQLGYLSMFPLASHFCILLTI